jgi:putative Mn2+ efflux pump MntP
VGACIGAFAIALSWATVRINHPALNITSYVSTAVFLVTMAGMILVSVLCDYVASMRAIFGAICVYLLIGLCWAMMYSALEYVQSDAFALAHRTMPVRLRDGREITSYSQMVYFSFVTMTSLGYGDITPRTPAAQTLTWLQAVAGQLYITVLIARLVSALPQTIPKRDAE